MTDFIVMSVATPSKGTATYILGPRGKAPFSHIVAVPQRNGVLGGSARAKVHAGQAEMHV